MSINRKTIIIIILFLAFFSNGILEAEESLFYKSIQAEMNGEYNIQFNLVKKVISDNPFSGEAASLIYELSDLAEIVGPEKVIQFIDNINKQIESNTTAEANLLRLTLDVELSEIDKNENNHLAKNAGALRKWNILYGYNSSGYADLSIQYGPEIGDIINSKSKIVYENANNGFIDLNKYIYNPVGVVYGTVNLENVQSYRLHIYSNSEYKIFVNNREVLVNKLNEKFRNKRVIEINDTQNSTVTIKIYINNNYSSNDNYKIIVTDLQNRPISPITSIGSSNRNNFSFHEIDEIQNVNNNLNQDNNDLLTAELFYRLNDESNFQNLRQKYNSTKNDMDGYLLGKKLSALQNRRESIRLEKNQVVFELLKNNQDNQWARYQYCQRELKENNFNDSMREALSILNNHPDNNQVLFFILENYLKNNQQGEFLNLYNSYIHKYPSLFKLDAIWLNYLKIYDPAKIMELIPADRTQQQGIDSFNIWYMANTGLLSEAISLINKNRWEMNYSRTYTELLIKTGRIKEAKKFLLEMLAVKEDPFCYLKLAEISIVEGRDPEVFLMKASQLDPDNYRLADLMEFRTKKIIAPKNPFEKEMPTDEEIKSFTEKADSPISIIFRGRDYIFGKNDYRIYCHDQIYLRDKLGVRKFGEYKIPENGSFEPVQILIKHEDGSSSEYFDVQQVNDDVYLSIPGLREKDIVELKYFVNNPFGNYYDGKFFSTKINFINNYNEPLKKCILKVEDKGSNIKVYATGNYKLIKENGEIVYIWSNVEKVIQESGNSLKQNNLYNYYVSAFGSWENVASWYNGLIDKNGKNFIEKSQSLDEKQITKISEDIYSDTRKSIRFTGNDLYSASDVNDVYLRNSGSNEERVQAALFKFKEKGISAYPVLIRNKFLPENINDSASPAYFSDILLMIPLTGEKSIWLDFSSDYYPINCVKASSYLSKGLVITGNTCFWKTVECNRLDGSIKNYNIEIGSNDLCKMEFDFNFYGRGVDGANYFKKEREQGYKINSFMQQILPQFIIYNYSIKTADDNSLLNIHVKGESVGLTAQNNEVLLIEPVFNKSWLHDYIEDSQRKTLLQITEGIQEEENYSYVLPDDYSNFEINEEYKTSSKFGNYYISFTKNKSSNILKIKKIIDVKQQNIVSQDYNEFLGFVLEVKKIENKLFVISKK